MLKSAKYILAVTTVAMAVAPSSALALSYHCANGRHIVLGSIPSR